MAAEDPRMLRIEADMSAREAEALERAVEGLEVKAGRLKDQLDATKADIKRFTGEAKAARRRADEARARVAKAVPDAPPPPHDSAVGARANDATVRVEEAGE